jgi:hypothetical protein
MMGTKTVPETVSFDHLTWLMVQEDFKEFGRQESFRSHMILFTKKLCKISTNQSLHKDPQKGHTY